MLSDGIVQADMCHFY